VAGAATADCALTHWRAAKSGNDGQVNNVNNSTGDSLDSSDSLTRLQENHEVSESARERNGDLGKSVLPTCCPTKNRPRNFSILQANFLGQWARWLYKRIRLPARLHAHLNVRVTVSNKAACP